MIVRVIIPPRIEAAFRKDAIAAYPHEHAAAMRGKVVGDTVTITRFTELPQKSVENSTEYYVTDAVAAKGETDSFVGVIHSHPGLGMDAAPSVADWKSAFECGEIVSGILVVEPRTVGKFRTELKFWESRPPIAIVHPRVRPARRKKDAPLITSTDTNVPLNNVQNPVQTENSTNESS